MSAPTNKRDWSEFSFDRLESMLAEQTEFLGRLGQHALVENGKLKENERGTQEEHLKFLHTQYATAIMMEGSELLDWIAWKHWSNKSGNKEVTPDEMWSAYHIGEIKYELIDILKFALSLCIIYGMNAEEIADLYFAKGEINHSRQDSGTY